MAEKTDFALEQLDPWKITGFAILCIRFVQGFIFWGGGSRRFIYAPQKLDPHSAEWLANKLQSAMPGALFGLSHAISFLLHHFILLYIALILFSLAELLSGIALIIGFFTRTAGLMTAFISITLMLVFGWQGATCLDEWTMAVSNLAMGLTLALSGGSVYSVDAWLLHRHPSLANKWWFTDAASGPWPYAQFKKLSILCTIFIIIFTVGTYNYYRGSVYSRYHPGPTSAVIHNYLLSNGLLKSNGDVSFTAYVNAGNAAVPSYIIRIELQNSKNEMVEVWNSDALSTLPFDNVDNDYVYNRITTGHYGLVSEVGAQATIHLPSNKPNLNLPSGDYQLVLYSISGNRFKLKLRL